MCTPMQACGFLCFPLRPLAFLCMSRWGPECFHPVVGILIFSGAFLRMHKGIKSQVCIGHVAWLKSTKIRNPSPGIRSGAQRGLADDFSPMPCPHEQWTNIVQTFSISPLLQLFFLGVHPTLRLKSTCLLGKQCELQIALAHILRQTCMQMCMSAGEVRIHQGLGR